MVRNDNNYIVLNGVRYDMLVAEDDDCKSCHDCKIECCGNIEDVITDELFTLIDDIVLIKHKD